MADINPISDESPKDFEDAFQVGEELKAQIARVLHKEVMNFVTSEAIKTARKVEGTPPHVRQFLIDVCVPVGAAQFKSKKFLVTI